MKSTVMVSTQLMYRYEASTLLGPKSKKLLLRFLRIYHFTDGVVHHEHMNSFYVSNLYIQQRNKIGQFFLPR